MCELFHGRKPCKHVHRNNKFQRELFSVATLLEKKKNTLREKSKSNYQEFKDLNFPNVIHKRLLPPYSLL